MSKKELTNAVLILIQGINVERIIAEEKGDEVEAKRLLTASNVLKELYL